LLYDRISLKITTGVVRHGSVWPLIPDLWHLD